VWPLAYRVPPAQLGAVAVIGFLVDVYFLVDRTQRIAFGAHAGGFICGLVIAAIVVTVYPNLDAYERGRRTGWR
jgi:membrane associated rhomboid family serine protease